jgi:hypothetical protein
MPITFDIAYGYGEGYGMIAYRPPIMDEEMAEDIASSLDCDDTIGMKDCTEFEFDGEELTVDELKEAAVIALEKNGLKIGKIIGPVILRDEIGGSIFEQAEA